MFDITAKSPDQAIKTFLYHIEYGDKEWRFNNTANNIIYDGNNYISTFIYHGRVSNTSDMFKSIVDVTVNHTEEVADLFISYLEYPMLCTIIEKHHDEDDARTVWKGIATNISIKDTVKAVLSFSPLFAKTAKQGIQRSYSRYCPYFLYDPITCRVDSNLYRHAGVITNITGQILSTSINMPDNYFRGGLIEIGTGQDKLVRTMVGSSGNDVTLEVYTPCAVGDTVVLYAGCDGQYDTCKDKFNNIVNYGGFPNIQDYNLFASGAD